MCCVGCENVDGPLEVPDHYLYDFGYHYTGAGSGHLFYGVLSGDKSVCNGCCERDRSNKKWLFGIVLGIVCIVSVPREVFQKEYWVERKTAKQQKNGKRNPVNLPGERHR